MASVEIVSGVVLLAGFFAGLRCLPLPSPRLIHISIRVRVAPRRMPDDLEKARAVSNANAGRRRERGERWARRVPGKLTGSSGLALLRSPTAIELASGSRWG